MVAHAPSKICARGIGSCVIVTLYCQKQKVGGMAHAVIPRTIKGDTSLKSVDAAVNGLFEKVAEMGPTKDSLEAKIIGGANMFPTLHENPKTAIGMRNVEAARNALKKLRIRVVAEETGGTHGRSVAFYVGSGISEVLIKV